VRPSSQRAVHAAADAIEPRMARAVARSLAKVREGISINDLAMALASKDARRALALVSATAVRDALAPAGTIARDAVIKGGKLGAEQVRKALEGR
jgi:hypothetical protein